MHYVGSSTTDFKNEGILEKKKQNKTKQNKNKTKQNKTKQTETTQTPN